MLARGRKTAPTNRNDANSFRVRAIARCTRKTRDSSRSHDPSGDWVLSRRSSARPAIPPRCAEAPSRNCADGHRWANVVITSVICSPWLVARWIANDATHRPLHSMWMRPHKNVEKQGMHMWTAAINWARPCRRSAVSPPAVIRNLIDALFWPQGFWEGFSFATLVVKRVFF